MPQKPNFIIDDNKPKFKKGDLFLADSNRGGFIKEVDGVIFKIVKRESGVYHTVVIVHQPQTNSSFEIGREISLSENNLSNMKRITGCKKYPGYFCENCPIVFCDVV